MPAVAAQPISLANLSVPRAHPRLFGTRDDLVRLARAHPEAYARTSAVARDTSELAVDVDNAALLGRIMSLGLVACVDDDADLARRAVDLIAERYLNQPVRTGHVPFGGSVAMCAWIYDCCHEAWTDAERKQFWTYMHESREQNRDEEPSVFHNGWYGYKMYGFGLGALATWHENPRAAELFTEVDTETRDRASPALELSGAGGGFGEGYYVHYWLFEWLLFCECARRCAGIDYYKLAPSFYGQRAIASLFEMYPARGPEGTYRPVPMGDGNGRGCNPERDKVLAARRILVQYHRDDPAHRAVHAFNKTTRMNWAYNAYRDVLWNDDDVPAGKVHDLKLSHLSAGPGHFHARGGWGEDATYLYVQAGPRFTSHQHLDQGHFALFKHTELLGDAGHYDGWTTPHIVNYYVRTIAHNSLLIHDPSEKWPNIRLAEGIANDGGQRFPGFVRHHNGDGSDVPTWMKLRDEFDTGRFLGYAEAGAFAYAAADITKAYAAQKVERVTRQFVLLRPDTVLVCDRIVAKNPSFRKTFLLHALAVPERKGEQWVVTNGGGRLFIQTLAPAAHETKLCHGEELYAYGGQRFDPQKKILPEPVCRLEISPAQAGLEHVFLHVLTCADAQTAAAPLASLSKQGERYVVKWDHVQIAFDPANLAGSVELEGQRTDFPKAIL